MIPINTYICYMSNYVFWPLLCVIAGVHQVHEHLSIGYQEKGEGEPQSNP